MAIDPYTPCPGGTGKKIKFCCSDLTAELDKVYRMLEGDQRVACLDYVHKLSDKHPGRACLLAIQSELETSLGKEEEAAKTLAQFAEKYPDNPIGIARAADLKAAEGDITGAIETLQKALELCKEEMPASVYETIMSIATRAIGAGHALAGQSLLELQFRASRGEDRQALSALVMLRAGRSLPLLLKDPPSLKPAPDGAPWRFEFDVALQKAREAQLRTAISKFTALTSLASNAPVVWNNLAVLRSELAEDKLAAEAWHKFAALEMPLDDAVEAEALAQLLDQVADEDLEPDVTVRYRVTDQNEIESRLAAGREIERVPIMPQMEMPEGEVPPRAIFTLLTKPRLPDDAPPSAAELPESLGVALLYGRQTDRPERLELHAFRADLPAAEALLKRIAAETLGDREGPEEETGKRSKVERVLSWQPRLPAKAIGPEWRRALEEEQRRRIVEELPKLVLKVFDNQSMEQLAAQPGGKVRALAFILNLDLGVTTQKEAGWFNELRKRLNLPTPEPIDPTTFPESVRIPLARLDRLETERLADDQLIQVYREATMAAFTRAIIKLAWAIVRRPSLRDSRQAREAFSHLANAAEETEELLKLLDEAREASLKKRESSAYWDLLELTVRLRGNDIDEFSRVAQHIAAEHMNEPGVGETFAQIMASAGLVDAQGRIMIPKRQAASPSIILPGAAEPGKIITPDTAAAGSGKRSAIWTPE
jgi:Flp pilus assembly protein TadD